MTVGYFPTRTFASVVYILSLSLLFFSPVSTQGITCGAGSYYDASTGECILCPIGTYQPRVNQTTPASCVACSPGRFSNNTGGATIDVCMPCDAGSANPYSGAGLCPQCAPGLYQPAPASLLCLSCPRNSYQYLYGATNFSQCLPCPAATPLSPPASQSVLQCTVGVGCEPGVYTAPGDSAQCNSPCPLGSYCQGGVLTPCPPGSFSNQLRSSQCTPCGQGYYGVINGSTSAADCLTCPVSTWSSQLISPNCFPCPEGTRAPTVGSTGNSSCIAWNYCLTSTNIQSGEITGISIWGAPNVSVCFNAAVEPIDITPILPGGAFMMHSFMQEVEHWKEVAANVSGSSAFVQSAAYSAVADAVAFWTPLHTAPSLRVAAFGPDPVLESLGAQGASVGNSSLNEVPAALKASISDTTVYVLVGVCCTLALIPFFFFKWLHPKIAMYIDQFHFSHIVPVGATITNTPSLLGAAVSLAFVWVAILTTILLATASNTVENTVLVPPSTVEFATTASTDLQLTFRIYTGSGSYLDWCNINSNPISQRFGFSNIFQMKVQKVGPQSCGIAMDCIECELSPVASVALTFPFSTQLVEWEVFSSSAIPGSWNRDYGVLAQLGPGVLLDASGAFHFNTIESYYIDARSSSTSFTSTTTTQAETTHVTPTRTGFEMAFASYETLQKQSLDAFNGNSSVTLNFVFTKSSVVLQSTISNKLSPLQMLTVVASSIVSLFSIFGIGFKMLEGYVFQPLKIPVGHIAYVDDNAFLTPNDEPATTTSSPVAKPPASENNEAAAVDQDGRTAPSPSQVNEGVSIDNLEDVHRVASPSIELGEKETFPVGSLSDEREEDWGHRKGSS